MQQLTAITNSGNLEIIYPSTDGEPVAETSVHLWAMITTLTVLDSYIQTLAQELGLPPERQGIVLANQFMYYEMGNPNKRVAPDVMVIPNVGAGGRDNYKIWEEHQVPTVIFEITSESTRTNDQPGKKDGKFELYQKLGVQEYWLFDPKGEWIPEQLRGYQLTNGAYIAITDARSRVLGLRLTVEGSVIGHYREATGEKLLPPNELIAQLVQERQARLEAQREAEYQRQEVARMRARMVALGLDPDGI